MLRGPSCFSLPVFKKIFYKWLELDKQSDDQNINGIQVSIGLHLSIACHFVL